MVAVDRWECVCDRRADGLDRTQEILARLQKDSVPKRIVFC